MKKTRKQLAEQGVEDEDTLLTEGDETEDQADDNGGDEERGSLLFDEADGDGADGSDGEDEEDEEEDEGDGGDDEAEEDDEGLASKPRRKAPGRRKKMSEFGSGSSFGTARGGDETPEVLRLREEMAEMRYQLHEVKIEKTIDAWGKGRFQFSETARKNLAAAEGTFAAKSRSGQKQGRIALSKAFSDRYRAVMLGETGIRLSERMREDVNSLLELALSSAIVDLSERGSSFDMEARMTRRGGNKPQADDSERLEQAAQRLSEMRYHKPTTSLTEAQMYEVYTEAAKEIGYK